MLISEDIVTLESDLVEVTGGAGFVGSHLVDKLMQDGHEVIALDNFFTGKRHNIEHWIGHSNFELLHHDVTNPIYVEVDEIYHLASPASPQHYMHNPIRTIKANTLGTLNMLGIRQETGIPRFHAIWYSSVTSKELVSPNGRDSTSPKFIV
ncbi:unnamed protein product [Schistosoma mattheei]|uniref:Uncharacterized protein n=1 Tax=Schistosoma mattheei TaxID=31246 RepID=A0A183P3Q0_9TREM|nr:unnamed protein product [Schistosoma mattheei]